jgi:PBP1b-binding outer membrane lipoprotein LpoB
MTTATWITMLLVMAFVWGGCAFAVVTAVRKESGKRADD